jgi:D-sedoheptulose 7-phosphate isomerase
MRSTIDATLERIAANVEGMRGDHDALAAIEAGAAGLARALRDGGRVLACGNGGSLCDAMHFAEELSGTSATCGTRCPWRRSRTPRT